MERTSSTDKRIVILTYGWVMVGNYSRTATHVTLTSAAVVRKWGTTKGLGQLALSGPTKETILEPCGIAEFPLTSEVASIKCEAWRD